MVSVSSGAIDEAGDDASNDGGNDAGGTAAVRATSTKPAAENRAMAAAGRRNREFIPMVKFGGRIALNGPLVRHHREWFRKEKNNAGLALPRYRSESKMER
jgi:hypothetical protein